MAETHDIREGARVKGSHGERLGTVETIQTNADTGEPSGFVVKTGFWPIQKLKLLSVNAVRQVNNDPDTVIVDVSKKEMRQTPALDG